MNGFPNGVRIPLAQQTMGQQGSPMTAIGMTPLVPVLIAYYDERGTQQDEIGFYDPKSRRVFRNQNPQVHQSMMYKPFVDSMNTQLVDKFEAQFGQPDIGPGVVPKSDAVDIMPLADPADDDATTIAKGEERLRNK